MIQDPQTTPAVVEKKYEKTESMTPAPTEGRRHQTFAQWIEKKEIVLGLQKAAESAQSHERESEGKGSHDTQSQIVRSLSNKIIAEYSDSFRAVLGISEKQKLSCTLMGEAGSNLYSRSNGSGEEFYVRGLLLTPKKGEKTLSTTPYSFEVVLSGKDAGKITFFKD
jgi:hypothetical protein